MKRTAFTTSKLSSDQPKPKLTTVVFHRPHTSEDAPQVHTYVGHPDDALFKFVFQTLGYGILVVESDGPINVREM